MRVDDLRRIRQALDTADLVLIGASNGLDMAEELNIFAPDAHFAVCRHPREQFASSQFTD